MKQILYIPTGATVSFHSGETSGFTNLRIDAGTYITSGKFKKEFGTYPFWNDNIDPFQLCILFLCGRIKDLDGELIFGDHVYSALEIELEEDNFDTLETEYEIIEV